MSLPPPTGWTIFWIAICTTVLVVLRFLTIYHVIGDYPGIP